MAMEPGRELLWKAAMNDLTDAEKRFFDEWLRESPENVQKLESIKRLLVVEEGLTSRVEEEKHLPRKGKQRNYKSLYLGALFLIVIAIAILAVLLVYRTGA